jgi:hypothetical protein
MIQHSTDDSPFHPQPLVGQVTADDLERKLENSFSPRFVQFLPRQDHVVPLNDGVFYSIFVDVVSWF